MAENRIGAERRRLRMSQFDLAEKIGVSVATVGAWEKSTDQIKGKYLIAMSDLFGVSTDYLLGKELSDEIV